MDSQKSDASMETLIPTSPIQNNSQELCHSISKFEAEVYDRQIRLWGVESQKRLREARILIVGLTGLGAEVTKNILLAGVKSITLLDSEIVTSHDVLSHSFLIIGDYIGKTRAESALSQCQELNPLVDVNVDGGLLESKPLGFFSQFDVVCLTNQKKSEIIRVDEICRQQNIKFFSGDTFGFYGYMILDLQKHSYIEESECTTNAKTSNSAAFFDENSAKRIRLDADNTTVDNKLEIFPPIASVFAYKWANLSAKKLRSINKNVFILLSLIEFKDMTGRNPCQQHISEDKDLLDVIKSRIEEEHKLNSVTANGENFIPGGFIELTTFDLSPVCAIVGGVISQEIIKAVSGKDQPLNNYWVFDGLDGNAIVQKLS